MDFLPEIYGLTVHIWTFFQKDRVRMVHIWTFSRNMWTVRSIHDLLRGNRVEELKIHVFHFFQMAISTVAMRQNSQILQQSEYLQQQIKTKRFLGALK